VTLPQFPGAVGLTQLEAYRFPAGDDRPGGSPHVHLACAECYVVVGGEGRLQTMTAGAGIAESPLRPGDVVWFTPGTIHRTVNDDGALRVVVVMQNGGLPEAGDAVLTFPPEYLADEQTYRRAASIVGDSGRPEESLARARRDLALAGFGRLRARWECGDEAALRGFLDAAAALVRPRLAAWRERLAEGALAQARQTQAILDALDEGHGDHLLDARLSRIAAPPEQGLGMCGYLRAYDPIRASGGQ
jgi:mannose-6-phosphate isomerase-like protein (cupin superfamily)